MYEIDYIVNEIKYIMIKIYYNMIELLFIQSKKGYEK